LEYFSVSQCNVILYTNNNKTALQKRKVRFIVNPFSGVSDKLDFSDLVKHNLDLSKNEYDIHFTKDRGHGRELSLTAIADKVDLVVAVGGDGTVNEVAAPLIHSKTMFGVLPGGSGNGFAMHTGLGRNMAQAIKILDTGKPIIIDTCSLNEKFYINIAGVGFDASIAYFTRNKKERGFQAYFKSAMREALKYKNLAYRISFDGKVIEEKFLSVIVANASMFGYNFTVAPFANLQDGLLDIVMINDASKTRYISSVWRFLNKSLHKSPIVDIYTATSVTIESDEEMHFHIDGEGFIHDGKINFTIVPKSLKIIAPNKDLKQ